MTVGKRLKFVSALRHAYMYVLLPGRNHHTLDHLISFQLLGNKTCTIFTLFHHIQITSHYKNA